MDKLTTDELYRLLADFAAGVESDVHAERLDWGPDTHAAAARIAERLGVPPESLPAP